MNPIDQMVAELCPEGVEFQPLASIGEWYGGGTPSKSRPEYWQAGTIPWISPKDMGSAVVASTENYITEAAIKGSATRLVPAGSVAMVVRSSILDRILPIALVPVPAALNQDMKAVIPRKGLLSKYVAHLLRSKGNEILRVARKSGGSVASIESSRLYSFRVPVPPIEVQREIVGALDTFTELEAELAVELEAELEARRRQYEHNRAALLSTNVGTHSLGDLARNLDSERRPVTKALRASGCIPYYGASGVVDHVREHIFDGDYLLVSEDGANLLARTTPIAFSITGKTWVNNHAHVLSFDTYAERRFVEVFLNSIDLSPFITGAAQPKLNQGNLNNIPVPDLPLAEKQHVVSVLDGLDGLTNDLRVGLAAERAARRKQYEYYRDKLLTFEELTS